MNSKMLHIFFLFKLYHQGIYLLYRYIRLSMNTKNHVNIEIKIEHRHWLGILEFLSRLELSYTSEIFPINYSYVQ